MKLRQWMLRHIPATLVIRPAEWFLAVLCFFSGLVIVANLGEPPSVAKLLWHPVYEAWGASLLVGSVCLIAGLSSIRWTAQNYYVVNRIPAYRLGLRLLGCASTAYAVAIGIFAGWNGAVSVAITLAFAATCFLRLLTLVQP